MRQKRRTTIVCVTVLLLCALFAPRVSADPVQSYLFFDADGQEAFVNADNVTTLASAADLTLSGGWYIVDSAVTVENGVTAEGNVYLILADGGTLTVGRDFTVKENAGGDPGFVNVYCQSSGTGTLSARNIEAANGELYFIGGTVSASGTVSAQDGSKVHLRWSKPGNSVTAAAYGANVDLEDTFAADGEDDPVTASGLASLGGKKLVPAFFVSFDKGDGTGTMDTVAVPASSPSYALPECTFQAPNDMAFDHWELLEDTVSTTVSSPYTLTNRNTTFIAKYETVQTPQPPDPPQPEDVSWAIENGVLTISGTGTMEDYGRGASPWFARRAEITSVVIGSGVNHIGNYAFYACGAVESVTIRGTGVTVGDRAFAYCCGLSTVTLGENATVASVGEGAFYACFKLRNQSFANGATVGSKAYDLCGLGD